MEDEKEEIAKLVKKISLKCGYERGAICAVDCLLQWRDGQYNGTIDAWNRYLKEIDDNDGHMSAFRHDAWVPAIPL